MSTTCSYLPVRSTRVPATARGPVLTVPKHFFFAWDGGRGQKLNGNGQEYGVELVELEPQLA
jgi:hypothetical protein